MLVISDKIMLLVLYMDRIQTSQTANVLEMTSVFHNYKGIFVYRLVLNFVVLDIDRGSLLVHPVLHVLGKLGHSSQNEGNAATRKLKYQDDRIQSSCQPVRPIMWLIYCFV